MIFMSIKLFLSIGITVICWGIEIYCAKLKNPIWGGIIPLLALTVSIYILATGLIAFNSTSFIVFFVLNFFLFEGWVTGREKYKKNQKAELDKMKAHDIDI